MTTASEIKKQGQNYTTNFQAFFECMT